jgi:hypothetical protein
VLASYSLVGAAERLVHPRLELALSTRLAAVTVR